MTGNTAFIAKSITSKKESYAAAVIENCDCLNIRVTPNVGGA